MSVRSSALRGDRSLSAGRFLVLISVRSWVDPRAIVRLEGLGQLKNPMTSSEIHLPSYGVGSQRTTILRAPYFAQLDRKILNRTGQHYSIANQLRTTYLTREGEGVVLLCSSGNFSSYRAPSRNFQSVPQRDNDRRSEGKVRQVCPCA
jgi:hypothetical protein